MIVGSTNDNRLRVHLANNTAKIAKQIGANVRRDQCLTALSAEDQMNDEIGDRASQVVFRPARVSRWL